MLGYLVAIPALLLLGRWLFRALRASAATPAPPSPDNIVGPGTLRTVAHLTGPRFEDDEGDDPQSMGEPLARAIHDGLCARGFSPEEPYYSGSQGYALDVPFAGIRYDVSCGLYDGSEDEQTDEWLVFVSLIGPRSSEGRRKPAENTPNARKLVSALHEAITALPGLIRLRWQADEAFERLRDDWHAEPF